jgi:hypothetical protein
MKHSCCFRAKSAKDDLGDSGDITSPDGTFISQLVALTQAVRSQADAINALKDLPTKVSELEKLLLEEDTVENDEEQPNKPETSNEDLFEGFIDLGSNPDISGDLN